MSGTATKPKTQLYNEVTLKDRSKRCYDVKTEVKNEFKWNDYG